MNLNRQTNRWCPPRVRYPAMFRKTGRKPSRIRGLAFFGYMKLFPYFLGGSRHFSAGTRRLLQPMDRKLPQQGVQYTAQGNKHQHSQNAHETARPSVTAASTQMEGSPTEEPTTWG